MSITEYDLWARYVVGYDSTKVQQVQTREHIDGINLVETVTLKPYRVWAKTADGLVELQGEDKDRALTDFFRAADDQTNKINNGEIHR